MEYTTVSEVTHHTYLLVRRGIGWLDILGDINQSNYFYLQNTSIKYVVKANNNSL